MTARERRIARSALATVLLAAGLAARAAQPPQHQPHKPIPQQELEKWAAKLYDGARPKEYTGERLGYLALPLGGIGTGSLALAGDGRLVQWQIFNNFNKRAQINDTLFAVWARPAGGQAVARALQTAGLREVPTVEGLTFVGEYPLAWLTYDDPKLPVHVRLEAFNPLIPLNPRDSAIPCAVFTFTVSNTGQKACDVSVLATLQNAVGYTGHGGYAGTSYPGFVRNRNQLKRADGLTLVSLGAEPGQPAAMAKPVRLFTDVLGREEAACTNLTVARPASRWGLPTDLAKQCDVVWLDRVQATGFGNEQVRQIADAIEQGAALLASGRQGSLAALFATAPRSDEGPAGPPPKQQRPDILFEDFEAGSYDRWTIEGKAFGEKPAAGTLPNQQPVSGFRGKFLVNTYLGGDEPQGTATSRPFTIERRYINFLIGGGGHQNETCVNLLVGGKVVRTACGRSVELLEQACWDVAALEGKQAQFQIVDKHSAGWGHVNLDHILFSDRKLAIPGEAMTPRLADLMPFTCDGLAPEGKPFALKRPAEMLALDPAWALIPEQGVPLGAQLRLRGLKLKQGARVLLKSPDGAPLLIEGACGKGRVLVFLADLPRGLSWASAAALPLNLLAYAAGTTFRPATGLEPTHRYWGTMALATTAAGATAAAQWRDTAKLWADFADDGRLATSEGDQPSEAGSTWNAALAVPLRIEPGKSASATALLTWHFPNHYYTVNPAVRIGNMYNNWFKDAEAVAQYLAANLDRLHDETKAYHDAIYDTSLPYYAVDALTSQADVIRSQTCMWSEADHFLGFEGNACCPMNCTHVWNYAQTMARLFPSLERNVRQIDLGIQLRDNGMVGHRCAVPPTTPASGEATDGQAGTVLKTYREYLLSTDDAWLKQWYPRVKLAMQFLIEKDKQSERNPDLADWVPVADRKLLEQVLTATEPDGVIAAAQPNTYDCAIFGPNPFVGSLYLAALRAAEEMATVCGDPDFARQCRTLFERGRKTLDALLWNDDFGYYVQTYDERKIRTMQFGWGCHADQTMGQWWADILHLGDILPRDRVRTALASVFKHNWRTNFHGHKQAPRVYALNDDKGLLICTWPHGRRPDPVTLYSDEIWTGIEYEVAAEMLYQGLVKEGLMIVLGCRDRYDGVPRPNTCCNVGNPFDEVECGTNYARAMSSWSVLLALQGSICNGPKGILGFKPRYQPNAHRSFFTTPEGWGVFDQKREGRTQAVTLDLRYGQLTLKELILEVSEGAKARAALTVADKPLDTTLRQDGTEVRLSLRAPARLAKGQSLQATLTW